jgi:hypothetical protein
MGVASNFASSSKSGPIELVEIDFGYGIDETSSSSSSFAPGSSPSSSSGDESRDEKPFETNKGKGKAVDDEVMRFLRFSDPPLEFWYERLVKFGLCNIGFLRSFSKWEYEAIEEVLNELAVEDGHPRLSRFQTKCLVKHLKENPMLDLMLDES